MLRATRLIIAFALALLALGAAVLPLQWAPFTRALASRYSLAEEAGLPRAQMVELAEAVRSFVVAGKGSLPTVVDGSPGFDGAAVAHLVDVREVLSGARVVTGLLALALAVWAAAFAAQGSAGEIAATLRTAALATVALPLLGAVVGVTSFDWLFANFHGLFFDSGTWVFPADSLLIRLFPEPFWIACGVGWALLTACAAGAYMATSALMLRRGGRQAGATRAGAPAQDA